MVFVETLLTLATEKVGAKLIEGIGAKLNPKEIEGFLKEAIASANKTYPKLFSRFQKDGIKGYGRFLNGFFKGRALVELQKPLKVDQGQPDVVFLSKALEQEAQGHSTLHALNPDYIEPWMQVFVETYFQATDRHLQFQIIKEDYCDQIRRVFDDVKFAGISVEGQDIDRAEKLADIFVMPDVTEEEGRRRYVQSTDKSTLPIDLPNLPDDIDNPQQRLIWEQRQQIMRMGEASGRSPGRTFSAADLLTKGKSNRAVLLGAPGSGKTTLMNYFAVVGTGKLDTERLPIIIRIRDWARHPDLSLLEFVRFFAETDLSVTRNLTGFFEYYLDNGNALILLDGLDEVADVAQRYKVVEKIDAFLNQCDRCPAIITSRPAGYKRDFFRTDEYPHYELQKFDDEKIETFIDHWYDSRFELESERERRKTSLRKALTDQPRIKQLARNPLLLTIIALIHRYQARLPKERYKLYDKAVETLLTTWDSQKELTNHEVLEYLELDDLRRLMERLAYWIHDQGGTGDTEGGTLIDREELIAQLTHYIREMKGVERYQAKAEAKRFLEQIVRDRAGLLSVQGQDRYAFVHKTFQEYLTAMEIRDQQEEGFEVVLEHIDAHLHDPHWEEVLLLLIAQQKRGNPTKILKAILNHDTPYEQWLHRNLLFAGKVLAENVPVTDAALASEIIAKLMELEVSDSPLVGKGLRNRIFRVISSLYETAFGAIALSQLKQVQEKLGEWRFLYYLGELSPNATKILLKHLEDENPSVRSRAADTLGKLGQRSDTVVNALIERLGDDNSAVRYWATDALGKLGQRSDTVANALIERLGDDNSVVRYRATNALGKLFHRSDTVINVLLGRLDDDDVEVWSSAADAVGKLGQRSETVVNALLERLEEDAVEVRSRVAEALGTLGYRSDIVVNALLRRLGDDDSLVKARAAEALGKLGLRSDTVVNALLGHLEEDDSSVQSNAAEALGKLGQGSDTLLNALLELIKDDDSWVRYRAANGLGALGQGSDTVVNALLEHLEDDDSVVRSRASAALGNLGQGVDGFGRRMVQWIEQHQEEDYVSYGVDVLWTLVS